MGGEGVQAPWTSLTWADYHAEVRKVSAYRPDRLRRAAWRGMLSALGEVLGLFDDRRVEEKGLPSRDVLLAVLGDVLRYSALDWDAEIGGDTDNWPCRAVKPMLLRTDMNGAEEYVGYITTVIGNVCDGDTLHNGAIFLCFEAGFSTQEVAFYNLERLRAEVHRG
jgi:hypothetical protein